MNGLDRIVSGEVRRWLARGGQSQWTAQTLWDEVSEFVQTAPAEERLMLLAALQGFMDGLQAAPQNEEKKEA